jgi:transposase-like protein
MNMDKKREAYKVVYKNIQERGMGKRKKYTPEENVLILREIVEDGKAVSTVANNQELNPNLILNWRKQMVENARETFTIKRSDISGKAQERRIKGLEAKLLERETLIAALAQENLELKKRKMGGIREREEEAREAGDDTGGGRGDA